MTTRIQPAGHVLAVVDGSPEHREAALAGADLFASTPGLQFTVLAPAEIAQPSGAPSASSNGLVQMRKETSVLMQTVRAIEDRGLKTKLRTCEKPLLACAAEIAESHDLVILPSELAALSGEFPVPVLLAP